MKRWEFTGERKEILGITLSRIRAVVSFTLECGIEIKAGENGGWIEKEENLSGNAWVQDNAWVSGNAQVYGNAWVSGNAWVHGNALVSGNAQVYGNALILNNAWVQDNARISGNAVIFDDVLVQDNAQVSGNTHVQDNAWVSGNAHVYGNAQVSGNAHVYGNAQVSGNALVFGNIHYFQIGPAGSRNDYTTFTRDKMGSIYVSCGCFFGTIAEFRKKVKETHGDSKHAKVYLAAADLAELQIDTTPITDELKEEEK